MQLLHGRSLFRRRDAELPIHQLSRRAGRTAPLPVTSGPGIPRVVAKYGDLSRYRTGVPRLVRPATTDAGFGIVPGEGGLNGSGRRQTRGQTRPDMRSE